MVNDTTRLLGLAGLVVVRVDERAHDGPVVSAAFTAHAIAVLPDTPEPVAVLGIDETRRGRPQWTGGMSGSWTSPAGRVCSGRSRAAPPRW